MDGGIGGGWLCSCLDVEVGCEVAMDVVGCGVVEVGRVVVWMLVGWVEMMDEEKVGYCDHPQMDGEGVHGEGGLYLAVSDLGVAMGVGGEHPPEGGDAGGVLEGGVVGEGAVEVPLDLLRGQGVLAHGPRHQVVVVTLV